MVPEPTRLLEMATLGCAMVETSAARVVVEELEEKHFALEPHRDIFLAVKGILDSGGELDVLTLSSRMNRSSVGTKYLTQCVNAMGSTTAMVETYISEVKRLWTLREIRDRLVKFSPQASLEEVEEFMQLIQERDTGSGLPIVKSTDVIHPYLSELEQGRSLKTRVDTGFPSIDKAFYAQPGDLVTIAARTGIGKTALMTNMLVNMAMKGITCLYVPTEMRPSQFMGRVMPILSGVPAWKFRAFALTKDDIHQVSSVGGPKLYDAAPFYILDRASPTIQEIGKAIRTIGAKAVFVDYLGRCSMPKDHSRPREVERFVVALKSECVTQQAACFLGVQLSRRTDYEAGPPKLADLSDSSAIEKESDAVIFMWIPDQKKAAQEPNDAGNANPTNRIRKIEAFFGKNRFGYPALIPVILDREFMKIMETPKEPQHANIDSEQG